MMGETVRFFQSNKKLELRIGPTRDHAKSRLFGLTASKHSNKTVICVPSTKVSLVATGAAGDVGVFLLTTAALEIVRKFSSARCPFVWHGLQALQILCCPPFKWIQKWAPFTSLVKGMQVLSRPLMFLSVATWLFDESGSSKGTLSGSSAELTELSSQLATQDIRAVNKVSRSVVMEDWLVELYAELDKQGITVLKPRTRRKLMIVGEDYQAVLSRYFKDSPPFLGGNCSCSKCEKEAATVGKKTSIDVRDHRLKGSSSDSELCVGSSLDTNHEHIKIGVARGLLLWVCVIFMLAVYYHQLVFPQLYYITGS
ncbi:hypothetical protein M8C21_021296 [Ambrosia artemisiifolia]|uniref:Uncharacterized protein n=1 Tax=Ambrosia artemisiifolia TaxID=4212 RepID=A0AAD5GQ52_AMBAR|nr:hypothetical protein M8C21_021296 [Ambrosia artemisiifolia]